MTTKGPRARVIDERQHSSDQALRCCSDQVSGTVVNEQVVDGLFVGGEMGGNVHVVQYVGRMMVIAAATTARNGAALSMPLTPHR